MLESVYWMLDGNAGGMLSCGIATLVVSNSAS